MNITKIDWTPGKMYNFYEQNNYLGTVKIDSDGQDFIFITNRFVDYTTKELVNLDFREIVDWSKVEVDTKVLFYHPQEGFWQRSYFAKYKNETVYVFIDGRTEWSNKINDEINHSCVIGVHESMVCLAK